VEAKVEADVEGYGNFNDFDISIPVMNDFKGAKKFNAKDGNCTSIVCLVELCFLACVSGSAMLRWSEKSCPVYGADVIFQFTEQGLSIRQQTKPF
jgi:hypothetical protein